MSKEKRRLLLVRKRSSNGVLPAEGVVRVMRHVRREKVRWSIR